MNANLYDAYHRGFLVADRELRENNRDWCSLNIGNLFLHYDPRNEISFVSKGDSFLIIIGRLLHVLTGVSDVDFHSNELFQLLNDNEDGFFKELIDLNGRFLIIFKGEFDTNPRVLNDACGLRSVFYSKKDNFVIGSHPRLVAEEVGAEYNGSSSYLSKYSAYHLPGNMTLWKGVRQLIPNHFFDFDKKRLIRFFPTAPLNVDFDVESIRKSQALLLSKQVDALNKKHDLLCSITAGIDSRVTLSATKASSREIDYFTYFARKEVPNAILEVDKNVVSSISSNLNLSHQFFEIPDRDLPEIKILRDKLLHECYVSHNAAISKEYFEKFSSKDFLHIRSNLLEICRFFYRDAYSIKDSSISLERVLECYSSVEVCDDVRQVFTEFLSEVNYDDIPEGYDPYDLFYWEYRMGVWHSMVLLESDSSFDTHILFNSRNFLNAILSVPVHLRSNNDFYLKMCEDNWPVLNYWGINEDINLSQIADFTIHAPKNSHVFDRYNIESDGVGKKPDFNAVVKKHSAYFYLYDSAPKKGDFVSLSTRVSKKSKLNKTIVVNYRTPKGVSEYPGRLNIVISIDGLEVHVQDISKWKELNQVCIPLDNESVDLMIKVQAIKNCENWSWGAAGLVILERISLI